jgi:hypothetical protein
VSRHPSCRRLLTPGANRPRPSGLTTGDFGWGSKTFAKMGRKKINLIARFLELGVKVCVWGGGGRRARPRALMAPAAAARGNLRQAARLEPPSSPPRPAPLPPSPLSAQVVISDVDVLWLRNPLPFFKRFPGADVLTSSDHLVSTVGKAEELERYPEAGSAFNIGIMLFQEKSLPFVRQWIKVRAARAAGGAWQARRLAAAGARQRAGRAAA